MRTRTELHAAAQRSETLLVLLPPSLSSIDDLYTHGFVDAVRQRHLPLDLPSSTPNSVFPVFCPLDPNKIKHLALSF